MQNQNGKITLLNGRIHTPNGIASGLTLENGRIVSIINTDSKNEIPETEDIFSIENHSDEIHNNIQDSEKIIDLKGKTVIPGFCLANSDFLNLDPNTEISDEEIISIIKNNVQNIPSNGITELWIDLEGENALRISEILSDEAYDFIPFRLRMNFRFNTLDSLEKFLATGLRTGDGRGFIRIGAVSVNNRISPNDKRIIIETAHMSGMQLIIEYNRPLLKSLSWIARKYKKNNPRHLVLNLIESESLFDDMKSLGFGGICTPQNLNKESVNTIYSAFRNGIVINAASIYENNEQKNPLKILGELSKNGLTMSEALSLYNWNAAWNGKVENRRGEISLGNDADIIVLEKDPFLIHPDEIAHIKIAMTFCAGCITYNSNLNNSEIIPDSNLQSELTTDNLNSEIIM